MKFHWGHGIAIFYTSFALIMIFMVIKSTNYDRSLVYDDYYAKDLAYQEQYDKIANSKNLSQPLKIKEDMANARVELIFPEDIEDISGEVHFYRPSGQAVDFKLKIANLKDSKMAVSVKGKLAGAWTVKVDWSGDGTAFYDEKNISIN